MRSLSDIIRNHAPLTLSPTRSVQEACRRMEEKPAGSVLITDEAGRLAGIFTSHDVVHRVVAAGRDTAATRLLDVMTEDPMVMQPTNTAIEALRLMWDGGFRHALATVMAGTGSPRAITPPSPSAFPRRPPTRAAHLP